MEQENTSNINGFDDGKGVKLDIQKQQINNQQHNNSLKYSSSNSFSTKTAPTVAKVIAHVALIASIVLFVIAGIKANSLYAFIGTGCFVSCLVGIFASMFLDHNSSKKQQNKSIYTSELINESLSAKERQNEHEITEENKINTNVKYNQNDYNNKKQSNLIAP